MIPQPLGLLLGESDDPDAISTWPLEYGPIIDNGEGLTGGKAYRLDSDNGLGLTFAQQPAIRAGWWLLHAGAFADSQSRIAAFGIGVGIYQVIWDTRDHTLNYISPTGAVLASVALEPGTGLAQPAIYHHLGLYASTGSTYVPSDPDDPAIGGNSTLVLYHNGRPVLAHSGAVPYIAGLWLGGGRDGGAWPPAAYVDDLYIETAPQHAAHAPPQRVLAVGVPADTGTYNDWQPVGQATAVGTISDDPHDDDATYIEASTPGWITTYRATGAAPIVGFDVAAVQPYAYARSTHASPQSEGIHFVVEDGENERHSERQALAATYRRYLGRFTQQPNGQPWTTDDLDDRYYGVEAD